MNSFINFKKKRGGRGVGTRNGRLHVGFRKRDWCPVWYEPVIDMEEDDRGRLVAVEPDQDGTVPLALSQASSGPHRRREPMEGEVVFLPHFALPIEESSNRRERERLQMQFLWDAWRYLNEDDEDKLETLEQELDNPNHRRWQSWFDEAKKLKTRKRKAQKKRLRRRRDEVEQALRQDPTFDIQLEDIEISGDTSEDDDSAYNSDADVMFRASEASHPKRKPVRGVNSGPASKKSKKSGPGDNGAGFMGTPPMGSGGLGSPDRDDSNRPQPNFNLGPSLTRSGATSSSSRSSGKRLSGTQRWRDDQESRRLNGDLDDDDATTSAI